MTSCIVVFQMRWWENSNYKKLNKGVDELYYISISSLIMRNIPLYDIKNIGKPAMGMRKIFTIFLYKDRTGEKIAMWFFK